MVALLVKTKMKYFSPKFDLEGALNDLLEVVSAKGSFYIKARDLNKYCDVDDHGRITRLGRLLAVLTRLGLAKRHNGRRPVRYTLMPQDLWLNFIDLCGSLPPGKRYRCVTESSVCGLVGLCPYLKIKAALKG